MVRSPFRVPWVAGVLGVAAVVLPVDRTVASLGGAHGVTADQLTAGVWCLKIALVLVAVAILLTPAVERAAGPARDAKLPVRADGSPAPLLAILGVALLARLPGLRAGLWLDEIDTLVDYVRLPFAQMIGTYHSQNHHPLYSLLARVSYLAMGGADWAIRVPALLFGVASVWATYRFAREVTDRRESLLAAALLAVSYHHVWFSQNARGYSALLFLTLAGSTLFLRMLRAGPTAITRTAWLYGAVMALAVYTHLTAAVVVAGHALAIPLAHPDNARGVNRRGTTIALAGITLSAILAFTLYAMVAPQVLNAVFGKSELARASEWTSVSWLMRETVRSLAGSSTIGLLAALVAGGVCLVGALSYWRRDRAAAVLMIAPPLLTGAAVVALHHNLWPRFFFFAAAFVVLIAFRGGFAIASAVRWPGLNRLATAAAALVVAASALTVPRAWGPKQDYVRAAQELARLRQPGDAVVTVSITSVVYTKYLSIPGAVNSISADSLRRIERAHDRTYILYTFPVRARATDTDVMLRINSPAYREVATIPATVGDGQIHIVVYERRQ